MDKLKLQLEHCYGIRKLDVMLDFGGHSAIAIYAPNGSMKSSLASTFQDIADGKASRDRIFPNRVTVRVVQDENSANIGAANVLVLRPYEEFSSKGNATATLLVNAALRQEYESLHAGVTASRAALITAVKATSKTKRPVEREVVSAFAPAGGNFDATLVSLNEELSKDWEPIFKDVPYDVLNDERVVAFLAQGDFRTAISDYTKKYNELLAASKYFKKGGFNYYAATNVAKELKANPALAQAGALRDVEHILGQVTASWKEMLAQEQKRNWKQSEAALHALAKSADALVDAVRARIASSGRAPSYSVMHGSGSKVRMTIPK
jgi:hypothetical protein